MAKFTDHHTRLKSVYFLSKKNEAIDALIHYTQDVVIPSGHRLQRLRSDRGGEYTGLEYREYCLQTGIKQEFAATKHRSKMAFLCGLSACVGHLSASVQYLRHLLHNTEALLVFQATFSHVLPSRLTSTTQPLATVPGYHTISTTQTYSYVPYPANMSSLYQPLSLWCRN